MSRRALLAASLATLAATSAPCAEPGPDNGAWARFEDPAGAAAARAIVASDLPGDASIGSLAVDAGLLVVTGRLGDEHGSRWTTLGTEIAPPSGRGAADLRGATALRIQLASAVPRLLRVRLKGGDPQIASTGCYPVMIQQVTPTLIDYTIPLSAFTTPGWCGANAATVEQTLPAVERLEVTANDGPVGVVDFRIGHIDFLAETAPDPATPAEPDGRWRLAWGDDFDGAPGAPASPSHWLPDGDVSQDGRGHVALRPRPRAGLRATPGNALQSGRVEVRLRLPAAGADGVAPGMRLALQGLAPDAGAIVMLESDPRGRGLATGVDGPGAAAHAQRLRTPLAAPLDAGFHTIACEWDAGRIRWFIDGTLAQESRRDELPATAWAGIDRHPLALAVSVDEPADRRATAASDPRAALVLDEVRLWQRDDAAASAAPVLAGNRAATPASPVTVATAAATARRRLAAPPQQAAAAASTPSKHVVCEHSARYELMLCY